VATIIDVASLAGVSTSTVSHVLNETRHVEPETRERVLSAVKSVGYRRDALARSLRRAKTVEAGESEPSDDVLAALIESVAAPRN